MNDHGGNKHYVSPSDLEDVLTLREKAERHLKTWTKKQLVQQLSMGSKEGWLQKWADTYDEDH